MCGGCKAFRNLEFNTARCMDALAQITCSIKILSLYVLSTAESEASIALESLALSYNHTEQD